MGPDERRSSATRSGNAADRTRQTVPKPLREQLRLGSGWEERRGTLLYCLRSNAMRAASEKGQSRASKVR